MGDAAWPLINVPVPPGSEVQGAIKVMKYF